jgi:hypothetical protein
VKFRPLHDRFVVKRVEGEDKTHGGIVILDKGYIREQANVALKTFVAPLSGVYAAAFGPVSLPVEKEIPQKPESGD